VKLRRGAGRRGYQPAAYHARRRGGVFLQTVFLRIERKTVVFLTAAAPLEAPGLVIKLFGVRRFKVNGGQPNLASGPPPSDGDARDDVIWRVERPWGPSGF
jgi:hypothetical protein